MRNLLKLLNIRQIRWYLEYCLTKEALLHELTSQILPEDFVRNVIKIWNFKTERPEEFTKLTEWCMQRILAQRKEEFLQTLIQIQQVFNGKPFCIQGKVVTPAKLAHRLSRLQSGNIDCQFTIGEIIISYVIIKSSRTEDKGDYGYSIKILHTKGEGENYHEEFGCSIISGFTWKVLPKALQQQDVVLSHILGLLGKDGAIYYSGTSGKKLTLYGYGLYLKSLANGKMLPNNSFANWQLFEKVVYQGDVSLVKVMLEEQYNLQKKKILEEAMGVLYKRGQKYLIECRRSRKLMDGSIGILEKISNKVTSGYFRLLHVPEKVHVVSHVQKAIFVFVYEEPPQLVLFQKILSNAGWGGSTIIATSNISPSLYDMLKTRQFDYLVQSELRHGDLLYKNEIDGLPNCSFWEDKAILCPIPEPKDWDKNFPADNVIIDSCTEVMTLEKITEKSCLVTAG